MERHFSASHPTVKGVVFDSLFARPLLEGETLAFEVNQDRAASVVALFLLSRPAAILGRIWTVIVDTFKTLLRRAWPHIGEEGDEVVFPTIAHRDSSSPIPFEMVPGGIVATLLRSGPCAIFSGQTCPVRGIAMFHERDYTAIIPVTI